MGRKYGGILGLLAFATILARGWLDGGVVTATIQMACFGMFLWALIGCVLGRLAAWIVKESLRAQWHAEVALLQRARSDTNTTS